MLAEIHELALLPFAHLGVSSFSLSFLEPEHGLAPGSSIPPRSAETGRGEKKCSEFDLHGAAQMHAVPRPFRKASF